MQDDQEIRERLLILEQNQGKLSTDSLKNLIYILVVVMSLVTGTLGLWAKVITAPALDQSKGNTKDISSTKAKITAMEVESERLRDKLVENQKEMIDRTEKLTAEIGRTVSAEVIDQRFNAAGAARESLNDAMLRIVTQRLQPQIDRNRIDTEDNENKIEELIMSSGG